MLILLSGTVSPNGTAVRRHIKMNPRDTKQSGSETSHPVNCMPRNGYIVAAVDLARSAIFAAFENGPETGTPGGLLAKRFSGMN